MLEVLYAGVPLCLLGESVPIQLVSPETQYILRNIGQWYTDPIVILAMIEITIVANEKSSSS